MKKKCIFPLALAAIMLLPLLASAAGFLNRITYAATYNYNKLTVGTDTLGGVTYATVSYDGLYNGGAPGMPSLPIDYFKFSVPHNATNFTVTATRIRPSNRNLDYMVYPCQIPLLTDGSPAPAITLPDTAAYFSGNPYPTQMAWIADEGFLAGENHIVTVAVMPLRYTHSTSADVLSLPMTCNLVLSYDLSDSLAMYPIVRNDSLLREEGYQLTQSMVVNPSQVKGFAPAYTFHPGSGSIIDSGIQGGIDGDVINGGGYAGGDGPTPIDSLLLPPNGVDTTGIATDLILDYSNYYPYLIVTTSDLKHAVRRIAALKRQKGCNVKVVTMDEVLSSVFSGNGDVVGQGRFAHLADTTDAGKLRQFIRNYYKFFGTEYVLLAGDDFPHHTYYGEPTDMYFSDLTADWIQSTDYMPELYVGRITSLNAEEVNSYTDKLFRYELNPGHGNTSYLRKAFFSEGREYKDTLRTFKSVLGSIFPNQVIINDYKNNNAGSPTGKEIIDTLRTSPVGFMCIYNHGDTTITRVYGKDSQGQMHFIHAKKTNSDGDGLNNLKNKWYPIIYYSPSCTTIPFDRSKKLTFGESFINGKDYGGPVYMGYTRFVYPHEGSKLTNSFANRIDNGCVKLGIAFSFSKIDSDDDANTAKRKQVYFGDPELDLWTDNPQSYSNVEVVRTNDSISISGLSADSTIIGYQKKNKQFKTKIVTSQTVTLQDAAPNSTIMLHKHNYIPYIAPLKLQRRIITDSQYIIASDVIAGIAIDNHRTYGKVIVKNGIEYEVESSGTVTLEDGFEVEKGATFAVYPASF